MGAGVHQLEWGIYGEVQGGPVQELSHWAVVDMLGQWR